MSVLLRSSLALLATLLVAGCSSLPFLGLPTPAEPSADVAGRYPDVLAVELRPLGDRSYDVAVTISSPYDTPARYADGWRVLDPQGNELGSHTLLHDHANEQPFTRTQRGLSIPAGIDQVTVGARDLAYGYGGTTVTVDVPD
ncbi:MAG: hypothetical protein PVH07_02585 [Chloroflexota bacterium]|jgi:hypothetical protein